MSFLSLCRVLVLNERTGSCLYDRSYQWSGEDDALDVASFIQSLRQMGREISGGELQTALLSSATDAASAVEAVTLIRGDHMCVIFHAVPGEENLRTLGRDDARLLNLMEGAISTFVAAAGVTPPGTGSKTTRVDNPGTSCPALDVFLDAAHQ